MRLGAWPVSGWPMFRLERSCWSAFFLGIQNRETPRLFIWQWEPKLKGPEADEATCKLKCGVSRNRGRRGSEIVACPAPGWAGEWTPWVCIAGDVPGAVLKSELPCRFSLLLFLAFPDSFSSYSQFVNLLSVSLPLLMLDISCNRMSFTKAQSFGPKFESLVFHFLAVTLSN